MTPRPTRLSTRQFTTPGVHSVVAELLNLPANVAMGNNRLEARIKRFPSLRILLWRERRRDFGDLCADLAKPPGPRCSKAFSMAIRHASNFARRNLAARHFYFVRSSAAALNAAQWHALQQRMLPARGHSHRRFQPAPRPVAGATPDFSPFPSRAMAHLEGTRLFSASFPRRMRWHKSCCAC